MVQRANFSLERRYFGFLTPQRISQLNSLHQIGTATWIEQQIGRMHEQRYLTIQLGGELSQRTGRNRLNRPQQSSTNQVRSRFPCGNPRRRKSRAATYFGDCGSRCISFRASCRGVLTNFRFMIPYPTRRTLSSSRNPIQNQLAPIGHFLNKFRPGHSWHTLDGHFSNAVPDFSTQIWSSRMPTSFATNNESYVGNFVFGTPKLLRKFAKLLTATECPLPGIKDRLPTNRTLPRRRPS